jgi:hypothetical protein
LFRDGRKLLVFRPKHRSNQLDCTLISVNGIIYFINVPKKKLEGTLPSYKRTDGRVTIKNFSFLISIVEKRLKLLDYYLPVRGTWLCECYKGLFFSNSAKCSRRNTLFLFFKSLLSPCNISATQDSDPFHLEKLSAPVFEYIMLCFLTTV